MDFYLPQDILPYILVALALIATLWLVTVYRAKIRSVEPNPPYNPEASTDGKMPAVSIIIYDKESSRALRRLLTSIYEQHYNGEFEIIVVSDGKSHHTANVVNEMSAEHRNLHLTFVPDEAHALSRKKLAIALGVKAARHPYVILTESDMLPSSEQWLLSMGRHFQSGSTLVIGFASPRERSARRTSPMIRFDILADAVTYLSTAINGRPYRGSASCLGFERRLILDHKGLTTSVGLHNGEDDIFVSAMAPHANASVAIEPDALTTLQCPDFETQHRLSKLRHNFTAKMVYGGSRRMMAAGSLAMWIWLAATIAAALICRPNLLPAATALLAGLIWMTVASSAWMKAANNLAIHINPFALPLLMLFRPVYNLIYRLRARSYSRRNFTWSKP